MPLPPDFIFSQNNLQAYLDCPRRFELAYIKHTRWPAVQAEPVQEHERRVQMGARFHQMVFQHRQGLPPELLTASIGDPDLARWWQNYLKHAPADLPEWRQAEYELALPFAGFRLMARFDLLAVEKDRQAVIVDWKTTFARASRPALAARVQTRLYLFILANSTFIIGSTPPEQISLRYWFPNDPDESISFIYSRKQMEEDGALFSGLIKTIKDTPEGGFALTENPRACLYCRFRSLCGRGDQAGDMESLDDDLEEDESLFAGIDPDQIAGIAF
jgi:hypothetical protein